MKTINLFFFLAVPVFLLTSCDYIKDKMSDKIDDFKAELIVDENVEPAALQIWEACSDIQISEIVSTPLTQDGSGITLSSVMQIVGRNALVGCANLKDTAYVNNLLDTAIITGIIDGTEVRFAWGQSANSENMMELYALMPDRDGNAAMEGDIIESAKAGKTLFGEHPCLSVVFKTDAARLFAELTMLNINRPLPIVVNGYVISAPIVMDRIEGGRIEITGAFSEEEIKMLSKRINACK